MSQSFHTSIVDSCHSFSPPGSPSTTATGDHLADSPAHSSLISEDYWPPAIEQFTGYDPLHNTLSAKPFPPDQFENVPSADEWYSIGPRMDPENVSQSGESTPRSSPLRYRGDTPRLPGFGDIDGFQGGSYRGRDHTENLQTPSRSGGAGNPSDVSVTTDLKSLRLSQHLLDLAVSSTPSLPAGVSNTSPYPPETVNTISHLSANPSSAFPRPAKPLAPKSFPEEAQTPHSGSLGPMSQTVTLPTLSPHALRRHRLTKRPERSTSSCFEGRQDSSYAPLANTSTGCLPTIAPRSAYPLMNANTISHLSTNLSSAFSRPAKFLAPKSCQAEEQISDGGNRGPMSRAFTTPRPLRPALQRVRGYKNAAAVCARCRRQKQRCVAVPDQADVNGGSYTSCTNCVKLESDERRCGGPKSTVEEKGKSRVSRAGGDNKKVQYRVLAPKNVVP
jgi:hypothetical protein